MKKNLLEIKGLRTTFATMQGKVDAIRGVDLYIRENEILGIVGESGSGKSELPPRPSATTARI